MKQYASSPSAKTLKPNQQKFLREMIFSFEKNGMKLNAAQRKELLALNEKIISYGIQFDRNLAESKDSVEFTEADLRGVSDITKQPWKRPTGKYMVTVNGPNYTEIVNNADNDSTRRTMLLRYNNRAYPKNMQVLDSLFYYRRQYANKLGFKSYAEYALADKMAAKPATVWNFEYDLVNKLTPHVTEEMNELRQMKKQLRPNSSDTLYDWDIAYYKKKLLDTKYQVNSDQVKEYFEMNNTLRGMFTVYEKLLNIQIKEVTNVPVWFSKVKSYEMYKEGKKIGNFYLDLFPRANKYTHFACFPISQYRMQNGKEILPVSALVCNFPEGNASQPSLLYHSDVTTLFHEFGHLVHSMLGRSDIASQGPFSVKGDFTEAPSQFLENWVWQYESLSLFAKHYKTGEVLPQALFNKMKQTQLVGIAMQYIRQAYLGMLDFTYEDKYDSLQTNHISIMDVSKSLSSIRQVPFTEGTHFIAGFTHLNGYAANYYGYLWSKVYAEDMFSVFKKNGVMDTKTGVKYRQEILEKASTREEMDMLRSFLGREPNSDAFLESLGISK
jgi:Zn-dependent oligopeptidase